MWIWARRAVAVGACAVGLALSACTVDTASNGAGGGVAYSGGGGGSSSGSAAPSTVPAIVDVDPDRTMSATGGNGVGVFVEYGSGGSWHVWWTCDTNITGLGCNFAVTLSVATGGISNVVSEDLASTDSLVTVGANALRLTTATSTGLQGVRLATAPGTVLTVEAKLNGVDDGSVFFFVQDNQINGGYRGGLADPLMFEPSAP